MIASQTNPCKFSQRHKSKKIQLANEKFNATNPEWDFSFELAQVEGVLLQKGSSIRFKIQSVGRGVYLGLGIKNVIAANSYKIKDRQKINHGCFLLSDEGWTFSHSNKEANNVGNDFEYGGDVIQVKTNEDELLFRNETRKWEFKMKTKLTKEEWQQACFCVLLAGYGASVSILDPSKPFNQNKTDDCCTIQ